MKVVKEVERCWGLMKQAEGLMLSEECKVTIADNVRKVEMLFR